MSDNDFDKAGRACFKLDPPGMLRWLLPGLIPACVFQRWADARTIAFPGEPERTCDTVAELLQAGNPPVWWLLVIELQSELDEEMFGRLLEYLGRLWRYARTPEQSQPRYNVAAALVNSRDGVEARAICACRERRHAPVCGSSKRTWPATVPNAP